MSKGMPGYLRGGAGNGPQPCGIVGSGPPKIALVGQEWGTHHVILDGGLAQQGLGSTKAL